MNQFRTIGVLVLAVWVMTGIACYEIGTNEGLREQDAKTINDLVSSHNNLKEVNKRLVTIVNFAIKQDSTEAIRGKVKEVGIKIK